LAFGIGKVGTEKTEVFFFVKLVGFVKLHELVLVGFYGLLGFEDEKVLYGTEEELADFLA
jgi:hypothetical protein